MDLADLKTFAQVARSDSLRESSRRLNLSASAVSKGIRRLESNLGTTLFERVGRRLRLSADGALLLQRSQALLDLAEQTRSEFGGARAAIHCRVAAPAVLQWRHATAFAAALTSCAADAQLEFRSLFEDQAADALAAGAVDFALVSAEVINKKPDLGESLQALPLGQISTHIAAGADHPLIVQAKPRRREVRLSARRVLSHDFAAPRRSFYCGIDRGPSADGWTSAAPQRRVRYWIDDLRVLIELARSGLALTFLPDFALREPGLFRVRLLDGEPECVETIYVLWRPTAAHGWHRRVLDRFVQRPQRGLGPRA